MSTPRLQLLPAVDVAGGQAVRLVQGEAGTETGYGDPVEAALAWQEAGAEWVHLVDLDAAFGRGECFIERFLDRVAVVLDIERVIALGIGVLVGFLGLAVELVGLRLELCHARLCLRVGATPFGFLRLGDALDLVGLGESLGGRAIEPQSVWCSWYSYYEGISQEALEREIPQVAELGFKTLQIDDGWEVTDVRPQIGVAGGAAQSRQTHHVYDRAGRLRYSVDDAGAVSARIAVSLVSWPSSASGAFPRASVTRESHESVVVDPVSQIPAPLSSKKPASPERT